MVEQGTHKPLVGGSNPPSATRLDDAPTALLTREGRSDSFTSRGATIRSRPSSVSRHEAQDLRHGVLTGLDAILAPLATHGRRLLDPGGSS